MSDTRVTGERVPRFISDTDPETLGTGSVELRGENHHHLTNVLRATAGTTIEVCEPGNESILTCRVLELSKSSTRLEVLSRRSIPAVAPLHLLIGRPKASVCDAVVEKCVELGVQSVTFFESARSQGRLDSSKKEKRAKRFARIAESALKQSGFHWPFTSVTDADSLEQAVSGIPGGGQFQRIALSPDANTSMQTLINTGTFDTASPEKASVEKSAETVECYLVFGPEGGLTEEELNWLTSKQCHLAHLGTKTLRVETAVLVASALALAALS